MCGAPARRREFAVPRAQTIVYRAGGWYRPTVIFGGAAVRHWEVESQEVKSARSRGGRRAGFDAPYRLTADEPE